MGTTPNYKAENERRKRAVQRESDFLKREVIGQGVEPDLRENAQNAQSNIERTIEDTDEKST